jgi:signal transduction histidine kinase
VSRNLITRMGIASGVVAALVAAVFLVLVTAVQDQQDATASARHAQTVIAGANATRQHPTPAAVERLAELVKDDPVQSGRVTRLASVLGSPLAGRLLDAITVSEQATSENRSDLAQDKADLATTLAIGGLIGSVALIALLASYLIRFIVLPVRRTARAARRIATGDLTVRVPEEGDAEPIELAQAFNAMADSLQESERLKDEFFALVSHELRTPLTSIIGYLELVLDDEELSEEARRFLEVVERNAQRLLRLVGDMLFLAQVEAGRLSLESTDVDLERVTADAVEAARPAAERAGVNLALHGAPVRTFNGDRDRCGQMIDNLISNALKFTPPDGRVDVRLSDAGDRAILEVTDTGSGIPDAEQARLFERFFRASSATSAAIPGAGLGLAIVKTIVEAHGGRVALASREGEGTTVRVELPYERALAAVA